MKPSTSLARFAFCLSSMASLAAAWPAWLPELDHLIVRQDEGDEDATPTPTPTPSRGSGSQSSSTRNLNTAVPNASGTTRPKGNSTRTEREQFDPTDPAGGVVMITPAAIAATPALYKVGDNITWAWNYTNVKAEPTAIDVILSCSQLKQTWLLTGNMSFEAAPTWVWDSRPEASNVQSPLLTEKYTLIIKDSNDEVTATAEPGYLAPNSQFQFAMYTGKAYTPLNEWNCATCSAAMSEIDRRALGFAFSMSVITILSFTWFVAGLHL